MRIAAVGGAHRRGGEARVRLSDDALARLADGPPAWWASKPACSWSGHGPPRLSGVRSWSVPLEAAVVLGGKAAAM
jgi:hypothetical protein